MKTSVTIVSTNLNNSIIKNYKDYHIIDGNFSYEEIYNNNKILFLNILNNISYKELDKLFKYLKVNNKEYINICNNLELSLYSDYLIIYDEEKILIEGNTMDVLKEEKLIKRIGLKLPFMIELSNYLKDYKLIDKIYLDYKELKGALWK